MNESEMTDEEFYAYVMQCRAEREGKRTDLKSQD